VGTASLADIVILPEIPYDIDKIVSTLAKSRQRKNYQIIVMAEGAYGKDEPKKGKVRLSERQQAGFKFASDKLAQEISERMGVEVRTNVPGHLLRSGSPSAFDRNYTLQLGAYAAQLIEKEIYGVTVAQIDGKISHNFLADIAGKVKPVPMADGLLLAAREVGIQFGD
jgi:6-phosphofructokinase 1